MVNKRVHEIEDLCRKIGTNANNMWAKTVVYNFHVWLKRHLILSNQQWNNYLLGDLIRSHEKWLQTNLTDLSQKDAIDTIAPDYLILKFDDLKRPFCWPLVGRWLLSWGSKADLEKGGIIETCAEVVEEIARVVQQALRVAENPHDPQFINERKDVDPLQILNVLDSVTEALSKREEDPSVYVSPIHPPITTIQLDTDLRRDSPS
ncbi:hypothetical protein JCM3765_007579 [Sporobolomyces pararoseus]